MKYFVLMAGTDCSSYCVNGQDTKQKTLGGRCDFGLASDILIFLKLCLDRKSYGEYNITVIYNGVMEV